MTIRDSGGRKSPKERKTPGVVGGLAEVVVEEVENIVDGFVGLAVVVLVVMVVVLVDVVVVVVVVVEVVVVEDVVEVVVLLEVKVLAVEVLMSLMTVSAAL